MPLFLLACAIGFVLLARAADEMVVGSARLAVAFKVSPVVIGAVVIGFGTSAPELLVSALAAAQDSTDIAIGNIIGSNVANLTLVLGAAALLCDLSVQSRIIRREAPLSVGAVLAFALAVQSGLSRAEGILLLVAVVVTLASILAKPGKGAAAAAGDTELAAEVEEFLHEDEPTSTGEEVVRTLLGLLGTLAGAQMLIWGSTNVAAEFGFSEGVVGLTLVAIGTSLPELVTAVQAARKREDELIVGNLLGSNLFNALAVGGVAGVVGPGPLGDPSLADWPTWVMAAVAVAAWVFMGTGNRVTRREGMVLLAGYVLVLPVLAA